MIRFVTCLLMCGLGGYAGMRAGQAPAATTEEPLRLGNFSVSLAVKDLKVSQAFYEKLGFHAAFGQAEQNWLILQNDGATIGLFQGMLPKNTLTFNPGWDRSAKTLAEFDDVRDIQQRLLDQGIELSLKTDAAGAGVASIMLSDPDGNPILVDQHVPKPKK